MAVEAFFFPTTEWNNQKELPCRLHDLPVYFSIIYIIIWINLHTLHQPVRNDRSYVKAPGKRPLLHLLCLFVSLILTTVSVWIRASFSATAENVVRILSFLLLGLVLALIYTISQSGQGALLSHLQVSDKDTSVVCWIWIQDFGQSSNSAVTVSIMTLVTW